MEEKTMAVKKVEDLMKELSEKGSKRPSAKDETQIMMGILNDTSFKVTTNVTKECAGELHCPAELFKSVIASAISDTTKMSRDEATSLAESFEISPKDANSMVQVSKDFINTTLDCGKRISLGDLPTRKVSLETKTVAERERECIKPQTKEKITVKTPEYNTVKAIGKCPDWLK